MNERLSEIRSHNPVTDLSQKERESRRGLGMMVGFVVGSFVAARTLDINKDALNTKIRRSLFCVNVAVITTGFALGGGYVADELSRIDQDIK